MIVIGISFFLSALGKEADDTTRGVGLLLTSFGALVIAVPLYIEATVIRRKYQQAEIGGVKKNLSPCSICNRPAASFWCTTHTVRLCSDCLPKHDEPSRCLYKTFGRATLGSR